MACIFQWVVGGCEDYDDDNNMLEPEDGLDDLNIDYNSAISASDVVIGFVGLCAFCTLCTVYLIMSMSST